MYFARWSRGCVSEFTLGVVKLSIQAFSTGLALSSELGADRLSYFTPVRRRGWLYPVGLGGYT